MHVTRACLLAFSLILTRIGNEPAAAALAEGPRSLEPPVHDLLMNALKRFLFVGGMPECVAVAARGGTLRDVFAVQDDLLKACRDDCTKYAGRSDRTCLDAVMIHAARHVDEQLKYTTLDSRHSGQTNRKAFELLCLARVLHKIPSATPAGLPVDREMQHRVLADYPGCGAGWVLSGGPFGRRPEQRIEFIPCTSQGQCQPEADLAPAVSRRFGFGSQTPPRFARSSKPGRTDRPSIRRRQLPIRTTSTRGVS